MKNLLLWVLYSFLICTMLVSCSKQSTSTFEGESDNWRVEYKITTNGENDGSVSFKIGYIGNESEIPKKVSYDLGSFSGEAVLNDKGVYDSSKTNCNNCNYNEIDEETMSVVLEWDGKKEQLKITK